MESQDKEIVLEFKNRLAQSILSHLKRLIVFGSRARGSGARPVSLFARDRAGRVADGRVKYREDIVDGIEQAPEAFVGLLKGKNFGKLVVKVGADPVSS